MPSSIPAKAAATLRQQKLVQEQAQLNDREQAFARRSDSGVSAGGHRLARPVIGTRVLAIWPNEPLTWG